MSLRDEHYVLAKHLSLHPENGIMLHGRSLVIFCAVYILSLAQPRRALNVRQLNTPSRNLGLVTDLLVTRK